MRTFLVTLSLLLALPALGATKVVVADLKGDKRSAATKPLRKVVCKKFSCVEPKKVGLPKKLDWKKANKEHVKGVLTGSIAKGKLKLQLATNPGAPAQSWQFTLTKKGAIKDADMARVRDDLRDQFAPPPPPEPAPVSPPPSPTPTPPGATPPPPTPTLEPTPSPKAVEKAPEPRGETRSEEKPRAHPEQDEDVIPLVHAELGLDIERRTQRYSNLTSNNLSEYEAPAIWSPRLRIEAYPLAHTLEGIPAGLGLLLDYRFAVGLKSAVEGGPSHATHHDVFGLDARLRIPLGEEKQYAVIPFVGYRRAGFRVDPASDGSRFAGLPQIITGGPRLGVAADLQPVEKLHVLAQADYVLLIAKGDLIGPDFFPKGSASAFELELGAGYTVVPHVDVNLVGELEHTGFSFDAASQTRYVASGASETLLGARLMAGYSF